MGCKVPNHQKGSYQKEKSGKEMESRVHGNHEKVRVPMSGTRTGCFKGSKWLRDDYSFGKIGPPSPPLRVTAMSGIGMPAVPMLLGTTWRKRVSKVVSAVVGLLPKYSC